MTSSDPSEPADPQYTGPPSYGDAPYGVPPAYGPYPPYGYGQVPGYGPPPPPPGWAGYAVPVPTNGMAIASLVTLFFCAPFAIVFGIIALNQISGTNQKGRGMAITGIVLGALSLLLLIVVFVGLAKNADKTW